MRKLLAVLIAMAAVFVFVGGAILAEGSLRVRNGPPVPATGPDEVTVQGRDHVTLHAWLIQPGQRNGGCVMVLHGIGDVRRHYLGFAKLFNDAGYTVLVPDLRGHGASRGDLVTYGLLEKYDVVAWANLLEQSGCPNGIFGVGESLGGAILLQALDVEPRLRAVVAECAYSDFRAIAKERVHKLIGPPASLFVSAGLLYTRWKYGLDLTEVSPTAAVARSHVPVLLIHGLADDRTSPDHSRRIAGARPGTSLWLVPGAGHTAAWATAGTEFERRVLNFLKSSQ